MWKNFLDVRTPFMRPLWRRIAFTLAVSAWGAFELLTPTGNRGFGMLFFASGAYLAHQYFWDFDPAEYEKRPDDQDS